MHFKRVLFGVFFLTLFTVGCKKWDDHTAVNSQDLSMNLLQAISQRSNLSKFYEYLQKTGLDKELANSKTLTVWAPTNDALQSIDPATASDSAKLRQFIANHIAYQSYFTRNAPNAVRVPMLNGKQVTFTANKFDEANITEADKYVGNGVLHVIDKIAPAYPNAWELVNNTKVSFQQSAYILSLSRKVFDPTNAIIDSINASTGTPIYRPGTDSVIRNSFNTGVYDLQSESKQYTYFILNDAAFNTEVTKLSPYFATSTADSTKNLASNAVVKDLIVEGMYTIDQLPATLTTKYGVTIPIDKSKIVETRKMSNGIAYVMSGINFSAKEKIPVVVVQGENPSGYYNSTGGFVSPTQNQTSAVFRRVRINPLTNQSFNDIFIYGHGTSGLNVQYRVSNLPSVRYKVYWVAVSDTFNIYTTRINSPSFTQRLAMGDRTAATFPYVTIQPNNYAEVYLGDYTQAAYGTLDMFLTAALSTAAPNNSLTLDYIKLVPDL